MPRLPWQALVEVYARSCAFLQRSAVIRIEIARIELSLNCPSLRMTPCLFEDRCGLLAREGFTGRCLGSSTRTRCSDLLGYFLGMIDKLIVDC